MTNSSKRILDYAKWDHLELSDDEEEEKVASRPPWAPLPPPPETISAESMEDDGDDEDEVDDDGDDAIHGEGDLEGLVYDPSTEAFIIHDESKVFKTSDGTLMYGKEDGQYVALGRRDESAPPRIPEMSTPSCYHGSSKSNFQMDSELQQAVLDLVDSVESDLQDFIAKLRINPDHEKPITFLEENTRRIGKKYPHLFTNEKKTVKLCRHAFAWAATEYLSTNGKAERRVNSASNFACFLKYVQIPSLQEKDVSTSSWNTQRIRGLQAKIESNQGQIYCLAQHLPCSCFEVLWKASQIGMEVLPCGSCLQDCLPHKLKACGRCAVALYCCRKCQAAHWPMHKKVCKKVLKDNT